MAIIDDKIKDIPELDENQNEIIDINLSSTEKRTFRINGDNNRLIKLNPSDMGFLTRFEETSKKLYDCVEDLKSLGDIKTDTDEEFFEAARRFDEVDNKMRDLIDYMFQSEVSEVCVPKGSGSMYDLFNGVYRFEHIINSLMNFYDDNIKKEHALMEKRIKLKTSKYTGSKKRK